MKDSRTLIFIVLFWSGITLSGDGFMILPAVRGLVATKFPTTEGTILSSEVTEGEGEDGTVYGVRIAYRYSVAGRDYIGDRYRYDTWKYSDESWANRIVANFPAGKKTPIFYNPYNPNDSVMAAGIHGSDLFFLAFMTPFNCAMLLLWSIGWEHLRRRWFKPVAGGVKIIREPRRARVRLTEWSPIGAALGAIALLAFITIFVMAISYGGHPPMRVMLVTWGVILCGGAVAGVWHGFNILSGKYDLIIDELGSSLELPLTQGRKTRRRVSLHSVESVWVETMGIAKPNEESAPKYAPTLVIGGDTPATERLVEWQDQEKARAFVEWLRERLPRKPAPQRPLAGKFTS